VRGDNKLCKSSGQLDEYEQWMGDPSYIFHSSFLTPCTSSHTPCDFSILPAESKRNEWARVRDDLCLLPSLLFTPFLSNLRPCDFLVIDELAPPATKLWEHEASSKGRPASRLAHLTLSGTANVVRCPRTRPNYHFERYYQVVPVPSLPLPSLPFTLPLISHPV